jgi:phospholipid transport system substrate-binding protein
MKFRIPACALALTLPIAGVVPVTLATVSTLLVSAAAHADVAADPQAEMEATARQLFAAIDQNRAAIRKDPKKANPLVESILLPRFDTEYAAQLVLAQHWRTATAEQRQRFVAAMVQMLMNTYAGALADFSSDKFKILPYRPDSNPDLATVRTQVMRSSGVVVPVDYKLRRTPGGWKAFDVIIEGISYVKNYRTDLGAEISQRGLDAVITRIERDGMPAAGSKP